MFTVIFRIRCFTTFLQPFLQSAQLVFPTFCRQLIYNFSAPRVQNASRRTWDYVKESATHRFEQIKNITIEDVLDVTAPTADADSFVGNDAPSLFASAARKVGEQIEQVNRLEAQVLT